MEISLWDSTYKALDDIAKRFNETNLSIREIRSRATEIIMNENNISLDQLKDLMREDSNYNLTDIIINYYHEKQGYQYSSCSGVIGFRKDK